MNEKRKSFITRISNEILSWITNLSSSQPLPKNLNQIWWSWSNTIFLAAVRCNWIRLQPVCCQHRKPMSRKYGELFIIGVAVNINSDVTAIVILLPGRHALRFFLFSTSYDKFSYCLTFIEQWEMKFCSTYEKWLTFLNVCIKNDFFRTKMQQISNAVKM